MYAATGNYRCYNLSIHDGAMAPCRASGSRGSSLAGRSSTPAASESADFGSSDIGKSGDPALGKPHETPYRQHRMRSRMLRSMNGVNDRALRRVVAVSNPTLGPLNKAAIDRDIVMLHTAFLSSPIFGNPCSGPANTEYWHHARQPATHPMRNTSKDPANKHDQVPTKPYLYSSSHPSPFT